MLTFLAAAATQPTSQPTSKPAVIESVKKVAAGATQSVQKAAVDVTQSVWDKLNEEAFLGNSWVQWATLFLCILGGLVIAKILSMILKKYSEKFRRRKRLKVAGLFFDSMVRPIMLLGLGYGLQIASVSLSFPPTDDGDGDGIRLLYDRVARTIVVIAVVWFFSRAVQVVEHLLCGMASKTETTMDDQLIPLVRKSLKIVILIMGVLYLASAVYGKNIGVIIGSLGIGGFAVALASKDMIANLFGSVSIFTDKPFAIGERIKIQGYDGVVEEVGFRSTRLRTLDGHYVTIPNSVVTNEATENISRRPNIKRNVSVTVEYSTPIDKIQKGVDIIRKMLDDRKDSFPANLPGRVHFKEMNSDNLEILATYWLDTNDWAKYLDFTQDFNFELMRKFEAEGIEFAFPTQTLYLRKEDK